MFKFNGLTFKIIRKHCAFSKEGTLFFIRSNLFITKNMVSQYYRGISLDCDGKTTVNDLSLPRYYHGIAPRYLLRQTAAVAARDKQYLSPLDADRIMSGNCGVVAIWVTQPLWPFRVPLTVICSVISAVGPGRWL